MSIRAIVAVGMAAWIVAGLGVAAAYYFAFRTVEKALDRGSLAQQIGTTVFEITVLTSDYLVNRTERSATQWRRKHETLGRLLDDALMSFEDASGSLASLSEHHDVLDNVFSQITGLAKGRDRVATADLRAIAVEQRLATAILTRMQIMAEVASRLEAWNRDDLARLMQRATWAVATIAVLLVLVAAATWHVFHRRVVKPIARLKAGIETIGRGDLDFRFGDSRDDEIGNVERSVETMSEQLQKTLVSRDALAEEMEQRKRVEDELRALSTSLAQRSAELDATNKELEAFAYSVSHDLRAPLRSMDGFSQALIEDYGAQLDDNAKNYLTRIRNASQRMALLIEDILHLSRVTRRELDPRRVDLSKLAESIVADLRDAAPERDVSLKIEPDMFAEGDASLLRIALENLLGNAWKFTRKTPSAVIAFGRRAQQNGRLAYYVHDNGAGFDMTYADKLFRPFERLHSDAEFEGTGVGLATVARVVARHRGEIWAGSEIGRGTTVYFTLRGGNWGS